MEGIIPDYVHQGGAHPHLLDDGVRLAGAAADPWLWEWDLATGTISRGDALATRFGYCPADISEDAGWWRDRIHPDDRARASDSIDRAIADPDCPRWGCQYRFRRRDGSHAAVYDHGFVIRDPAGQAIRLVGSVVDLSELQRVHESLRNREKAIVARSVLTGQIDWWSSADGKVTRFSDRWSELTGRSTDVSAADWSQVAHPDDLAESTRRWEESLTTGAPLEFEHRLKMIDGSYRWFCGRAAAERNAAGEILGWYGTLEDVHERKTTQLALLHLANFDLLTGFPNRHRFSTELDEALAKAERHSTQTALILLDLDEFKLVNTLFGHPAGDDLLASFARRMRGSGIRLFRIGGDEFAAIVEDCSGIDPLLSFTDRIHALLEAPFETADALLDSRASIGCALFPRDGRTSRELLKCVDMALYAAKDAGRSQTKVFQSNMRSRLQRRNSMLGVARRALAEDIIEPFFQPKVALCDRRIIGFEALMRIRSNRFGFQSPSVIGAAFEHPELSLALAERILSKVLVVVKDWRASGLSFGRIAINASPREFRGGDYADRLLSRLAAEQVRPQDIEVEVTETVFLERDGDLILDSLVKLKQAGVTIALDDFGTGYASLSHLRDYPVDVLKIDQSFVRTLGTDSRQEPITKGLIELSRIIGIQTVAEGVETDDQARLLQSFGCDIGQGYLFGRPVAAGEAKALLESRRGPDWPTFAQAAGG
jgi:diguanylate cyclase (GGDEF)-like protein/PAS domain S-box-containing protein